MSNAALANAPTGEEEIDGTAPDAEKGKLFEVPRVAILLDETDPTVLKLAASGGIELDRGNAEHAKFFNDLKPGQEYEVRATIFVKRGPTNTHRRDSEGNVDAIVATKSLLITDIYVLTPEEL